MLLTAAAAAEFGSGDRQRGNQTEMLAKAHLDHVGDLGAVGYVTGSYGEHYEVAFDFSHAATGQLGVYCGCPRFADGYLCKHLWASMLKIDLAYDHGIASEEIDYFFLVQPGEVSTGNPLTPALSSHKASSPKRSARQSASDQSRDSHRAKAKPPSWQSLLGEISQQRHSAAFSAGSGVPELLLPETVQGRQHWFVFSVSEPANRQAMQIVVMQSIPKLDGNWSRPTAVELRSDQRDELPNADERHALAMLRPVEEVPQYPNYRYRRTEQSRLFEIAPDLIVESVTAMHRTGRLAWKLGDSKQHFEDARPVDEVMVDHPTTAQLSIHDGAGKSKLSVKLCLSCPDQSVVDLDHLIWISDIGCALLQQPRSVESGKSLPPTSPSQDAPTPAQQETPIRTRLVQLSQATCQLIRVWQHTETLNVPKRSLPKLLAELSESHNDVRLAINPTLTPQVVAAAPIGCCFLEQLPEDRNRYYVTLTARYPNRELPFDAPDQWWYDRERGEIQLRNLDAEERLLSSLQQSRFASLLDPNDADRSQLLMHLPSEQFLELVDSLQDKGWEVSADGAPIRSPSNFDIQVTSGVDWFDLDAEVSFDDVSVSLPELLDALREGTQTIRLDDGSVGMLPQQWLKKFAGIEETASATDGVIRFHRSQGLLLDVLLEDHDQVRRDRDFATFLRHINQFDGIRPAAPPKSFGGHLRDYQQVGLGWMRFLQKLGFGGCLADDMGLGKTVQVLALLEARRKRRVAKGELRKPSIVVVPKSLIFNWIDEAQRFTPKLRVRNHTGTDRMTQWHDVADAPGTVDVLLTTYGTMRIDAPLLAQMEFDYAILDEAQAIKNPNSLAARAARLLRADHRLAMTGTPVENHLGDLWSLFDFLNPGMLGKLQSKTRLLPDLQDDEHRKHVERISRSLQPFIMRRTKSEVLSELPDKVEQTLVCTMTKKQQTLYDELRDHYRTHLSNKVKELGLKRAKIHVLEALLRMRQAACDPRLVKPDCGVKGAKITELLERLEELHSEGAKALVFSQFTSLLGLLKAELDQRGWNYEYLDGKTRNRKACVERFQTDPQCPFFLISLKAGGHGLNLTAAEYVFILDPWWNPAVEAQAVDRAHRMGQSRRVNAYRMICSDTVEEKILTLQQSKRDLADAIVSQNKSLIGQLTAQDLRELLG